jgi:ferritin-like metal-binding protein YciE
MNHNQRPAKDAGHTAPRQEVPQKKDGDLSDLFQIILGECYALEQRLHKEMARWMKSVKDLEMQQTLSQHQDDVSENIAAIERIFELLKVTPNMSASLVLDGLFQGNNGRLEDFRDTQASDSAVAHIFREILHAKIVRYDSLVNWAQILGHTEIALLLQPISPRHAKCLATVARLSRTSIDIMAAEQSEAAGDTDQQFASDKDQSKPN